MFNTDRALNSCCALWTRDTYKYAVRLVHLGCLLQFKLNWKGTLENQNKIHVFQSAGCQISPFICRIMQQMYKQHSISPTNSHWVERNETQHPARSRCINGAPFKIVLLYFVRLEQRSCYHIAMSKRLKRKAKYNSEMAPRSDRSLLLGKSVHV